MMWALGSRSMVDCYDFHCKVWELNQTLKIWKYELSSYSLYRLELFNFNIYFQRYDFFKICIRSRPIGLYLWNDMEIFILQSSLSFELTVFFLIITICLNEFKSRFEFKTWNQMYYRSQKLKILYINTLKYYQTSLCLAN